MYEQRRAVWIRLHDCNFIPIGLRLPHDERLATTSPGDLECMLVPMAVAVVIVRMIIVEPGEIQWLPTDPFVNDELSAFDRAETAWIRDPERRPIQPIVDPHEVRPEDRPTSLVVFSIKKEFGIATGIAVRIQKQEFFKRRVQSGEDLELPPIQATRGMVLSQGIRINKFDVKRLQQGLTFFRHLPFAAKVPHLNWQRAAQVTQSADRDVERSKKSLPVSNDDNTASTVTPLGIRRNGFQMLFGSISHGL